MADDDAGGDAVVAALFVSSATAAAGRECGVAILQPRARKNKADRARRTLTLLQFADEDGFVWLQSLLQAHGVAHVYAADSLTANEAQRLRLA